ncbi:TetR family transcriptional regulator [Streptomyces daghestanicus]|uniref:TetR family transcriptional regulator n=1 Tax=Streptomyces daghestanicus TaxID=66885 RepID=A0ABQ3Q290_9ACTN|nr:TetR family transcriptional regulator [Streptomyces daghestanicus]GHI31369.1 TetR family transcriptional regulator [Streptomyces daghestanicus]
MPRMSREVTEQHRRQVVENASRLIREKGPERVSVPEVMASAGLTHGGFYRHFASKDDLLAQALAVAFTERRAAMDRIADEPAPPGAVSARDAFLARYLSESHRDHPADGCPAAAVAADAARAEPGSPLRTSFTAGVRDLAEGLHGLNGSERDAGVVDRPLAELALLVGAVLLARASDDAALSRDILDEARGLLRDRATQEPAGPEADSAG